MLHKYWYWQIDTNLMWADGVVDDPILLTITERFQISFNLDLYTLDSLMCIQKVQKARFFSLLEYLSESKNKGYIYLTGLSSVSQLLNLMFKVSAFLLSEKKTSKWHIHSLLSQTFPIKFYCLYINSFYQLPALQTPPPIRTELDCDLPTVPTSAIY